MNLFTECYHKPIRFCYNNRSYSSWAPMRCSHTICKQLWCTRKYQGGLVILSKQITLPQLCFSHRRDGDRQASYKISPCVPCVIHTMNHSVHQSASGSDKYPLCDYTARSINTIIKDKWEFFCHSNSSKSLPSLIMVYSHISLWPLLLI